MEPGTSGAGSVKIVQTAKTAHAKGLERKKRGQNYEWLEWHEWGAETAKKWGFQQENKKFA